LSDFDEKTRVTQVVQKAATEEGTGNDCLVVIYSPEPGLLGKRFVLDRAVLRVGRGADNTVVLEGDSVSRRHARFEKRGNRWHVVDLNSTNGTYLNEQLVVGEQILNNSDRIKIGPAILKFLSGADAEAKYHEEIYRMTIVDGLTQIHNKRYLFEVMDRECTRARRHDRPLSVVMFDIDHFKKINDSYGHSVGDEVLRCFGAICRESFRDVDIIGRVGGEEFLAILPGTGAEGACLVAERVRNRLQSQAITAPGGTIQVTLSIGITEAMSRDDTFDKATMRADTALYEAKNAGRNRIGILPPALAANPAEAAG
jgi:diguanylate cyclase (GGDEF)-like protein